MSDPKLNPRSSSVVIYQGDDMQKIRDLRREADQAARTAAAHHDSGAPSRDGDDEHSVQAKRDRYDAFVLEASERAVEIFIEAIGKKQFRELLADHAPRKVTEKVTGDDGIERDVEQVDPRDEFYGVNMDTFPDAFLTFNADGRRTITAPEFSTTAACQRFLDFSLSDGDYEQLFDQAYWLNRTPGGGDPKGSLYSADTPSTTET